LSKLVAGQGQQFRDQFQELLFSKSYEFARVVTNPHSKHSLCTLSCRSIVDGQGEGGGGGEDFNRYDDL
jgi:hypothetical protein